MRVSHHGHAALYKGASGVKSFLIAIVIVFLAGCVQRQNTDPDPGLEAKVTDLEKTVDDLKPGLGEIMGVIQQHHAKLYYAGTKANWPLADYELSEIQEGLDDAVRFYPKFKEVQEPLTNLVPTMTKGSLVDMRAAIDQKNERSFEHAFSALSASCSSCHAAANRPFIKIQVPTEPMFSDQRFAP
jgi:hypothetical protein